MSAKKNKYLREKFSQYQNGKISDAEKEIVDEWFAATFKAAVNEAPHQGIEKSGLELWENIKHSIFKEKSKPYGPANQWFRIACAVLLIAGLSFFGRTFLFAPNHGQKTAFQAFRTANGKVKKIFLQDGTVIWMNAATLIRIETDFNTAKIRKVYLDRGEAFFQVKRDTTRPFTITTGNFITTVLGTSFDIRAYTDLGAYTVSVATGKVKVDLLEKGKRRPLAAGLVKDELLTYSLNTQKVAVTRQSAGLSTTWRSNRTIYANRLTLVQIGAELARQYNITVQVTHPEKAIQTFTLYLSHQDIHLVLKELALKTGMNYQLTNNNHLTINPALP
jgi:transmembrane sensor